MQKISLALVICSPIFIFEYSNSESEVKKQSSLIPLDNMKPMGVQKILNLFVKKGKRKGESKISSEKSS